MKKLLSLLAVGLLAQTSFTACGNNDDNNTNNNPQKAACSATIASVEAAQAANLANFSTADAPRMVDAGNDHSIQGSGHYRDNLTNHPGCVPKSAGYTVNTSEPLVTDNQVTTAPEGSQIALDGFPCAAEEFSLTNEDTTKPIVVLVHGNSAGPTSFIEYHNDTLNGTTQKTANVTGPSTQIPIESDTREMLVSKLLAAGYHVIAWDARSDLVYTQDGAGDPSYRIVEPAFNRDHGWDVPMLESLVKALYKNYPNRRFSFLGHSLGVTVIRDTMRRLYNDFKAGTSDVNPFTQIQDIYLASGANHGVVAGDAECTAEDPNNPTMVDFGACELGDRANWQPSYFDGPITGPADLWAAPCADGDYAFGDHSACGGNVIQYTTAVMEDLPNGSLQDEFVSQASAMLALDGCVDNETIGLSDFDVSGYFFTGAPAIFANHFGTIRSDNGMAMIMSKLGD